MVFVIVRWIAAKLQRRNLLCLELVDICWGRRYLCDPGGFAYRVLTLSRVTSGFSAPGVSLGSGKYISAPEAAEDAMMIVRTIQVCRITLPDSYWLSVVDAKLTR